MKPLGIVIQSKTAVNKTTCIYQLPLILISIKKEEILLRDPLKLLVYDHELI